jgi:hypothetical protein
MKKFNIHIPSDVQRKSIGRRTIFITERTQKTIECDMEYRDEKLHAASNGNPEAALPLVSVFLTNLAILENDLLLKKSEQDSAAEKAKEDFEKHKKEVVEALATSL